MAGVRLEANIHIVTAAVTSAQNIVKCANKAGLNVVDIVLEPLASAEAARWRTTSSDLGVCLIDIGGGTTDLAVFAEGSIKHTSVLGLGGYAHQRTTSRWVCGRPSRRRSASRRSSVWRRPATSAATT